VTAFERSGVSPAALASGYAAFFIYTFLVGLLGVVLTIYVVRKQRAADAVSRAEAGAAARAIRRGSGRKHRRAGRPAPAAGRSRAGGTSRAARQAGPSARLPCRCSG